MNPKSYHGESQDHFMISCCVIKYTVFTTIDVALWYSIGLHIERFRGRPPGSLESFFALKFIIEEILILSHGSPWTQ